MKFIRSKKFIIIVLLLIITVPLMVPSNVLAYGETQSAYKSNISSRPGWFIDNIYYPKLPSGWLITRDYGSYCLIENVNGAPYLNTTTILNYSANFPLPLGWVIKRIFNEHYDITNLNGAPCGGATTILNSSANFPLPEGWVKTRVYVISGTCDILYLTGEPVGYKVMVVSSSPIPKGWSVTSSFGDYLYIKRVF